MTTYHRMCIAAFALSSCIQACSSESDDAAQVGTTADGAAGAAGAVATGGTGGAVTTGGTGGAVTTGGTGGAHVAGGTGGVGGATGGGACGTAPPTAKSACAAGIECTYGETVALCTSDGWFVGRKATTAPLAPDAACNPVGTWALTYAPGSKSGQFCTAAPSPNLDVRETASGLLVATFAGGGVEFGADGCTVTASLSDTQKNPSESWTVSTSVKLTIDGDVIAGSYKKGNTGFCWGGEEGAVTGTRVSQ